MKVNKFQGARCYYKRFVLVTLLYTQPLIACLCTTPDTPIEAFEIMDAVFAGQVTSIDTVYDYYKEVTFSVLKSWKGVDEDHVSVITAMDEGGCGYDFKVDSLYLVYADSNTIYRTVDDNLEGTIQTHICTRTKKLSEADEDLQFLNSLHIRETYEYSTTVPAKFSLHPNYPNPFNPTTTIQYDLPRTGHVSLTIYDLMGREVEVAVNKWQEAGTHSVVWDASNVPSGIYFYQLTSRSSTTTTNPIQLTKKLIFLK